MRALAPMVTLWLGALCVAGCGDGGGTVADTAPDGGDTTDTATDATRDGTSGDADADDADDTDDADGGEVTPVRPWYERAVVYEIFVRSFQDSDGDGVGDLRGLVDRLDYLNDGEPGGDDLEVDGLWLMPIFTSDSYHGYDITDYRGIDPDYGTMEDFEALIAACEARGIKIVLDLVMNHTGAAHPWFLASRSGPDDPKRDWYVWRADDPGWKQPFGSANVWHPYGGAFYYGVFWSGMPDLNYREPAVAAEMTDVARSWTQRGAAGFRLDAARYLVESADGGLFEQPETHAFWRSLRAALPPESYLVGEVWTSRAAVATYYGEGDELHQAFDFDLQDAIVYSAAQGSATRLRAALSAQAGSGAPWSYSATFLSNHDLDRLSLDLTDGQQRAAAFLLLTLPGTPYIYYGDELGVKSAPALGDQAKRGPMAWTADEGHGFSTGAPWVGFAPESDTRNVANALANGGSLLRYHQTLIRLRREHPALSGPGLTVLTTPSPALFAMLRREGDEVLLAAVNLGEESLPEATLDLSSVVAAIGPAPWTMKGILGTTAETEVTDPAAVPMGPAWASHSGRLWTLKQRSP